MESLMQNEQKMYYCLYTGNIELSHEIDGAQELYIGERINTYGIPVEFWANISPATGQAAVEMFGNIEGYDKIIHTCDTSCPIDENSVLFIDKNVEMETIFPNPGSAALDVPIYDYVVVRVSKSINSIAYAVRKVNIGGIS